MIAMPWMPTSGIAAMREAQMMPRLILASGSRFRRQMLSAAGVACDAMLPMVDEDAERLAILNNDPAIGADAMAVALARVKALSVSAHHVDAWVIGADQVMALDGQMFSKPKDLAEAQSHLMMLSGHTHTLYSAVVLACGGKIQWQMISPAQMSMRQLSGAEIDRYLTRVGEDICHTVGAYALEGLGAQLFDAVEGDYFTVIGLPLLPLLAALRQRGLADL
jgi:septum formation protein